MEFIHTTYPAESEEETTITINDFYDNNKVLWKLYQPPTKYLYHYTSKENWELIKKSGILKVNTPVPSSGLIEGLYLTELVYSKEESKNQTKSKFNTVLHENNYGASADHFRYKHKQEVVIRIPIEYIKTNIRKRVYRVGGFEDRSVVRLKKPVDISTLDFDKHVKIRDMDSDEPDFPNDEDIQNPATEKENGSSNEI